MMSLRERVRCSCLKVAHSRELKSSLKNKIQEWSLEREERAEELNVRSVFHFLWVGNGLRGRWEPIYSSHLKKSRWGIFHWTSLARPPDKSSGPLLNLVKTPWKPTRDRTSLVEATRVWLEPLEPSLTPDKSSEAFWCPVKSIWNLVDSPNKFGEARKWKIWSDKHLNLSPNFFVASLLIVRLSYD
jgi:hypothetical protein